jgi:hypothetical protein
VDDGFVPNATSTRSSSQSSRRTTGPVTEAPTAFSHDPSTLNFTPSTIAATNPITRPDEILVADSAVPVAAQSPAPLLPGPVESDVRSRIDVPSLEQGSPDAVTEGARIQGDVGFLNVLPTDKVNLPEGATLDPVWPQGVPGTPDSDTMRKKRMEIAKSMAIWGLSYVAFYIVASELQLQWNHLDDINSIQTTGQIIPLMIGTMFLFRCMWLLFTEANWSEIREAQILHPRTLDREIAALAGPDIS